jgi:hypothetical protein
VGPEQRPAVRDALQRAVAASSMEPLDWQDNTSPERWRDTGVTTRELRYDWTGPSGASPFPLG